MTNSKEGRQALVNITKTKKMYLVERLRNAAKANGENTLNEQIFAR